MKLILATKNRRVEADKMPPRQFTKLLSNWTEFQSEAHVMKADKGKRAEVRGGLIQFVRKFTLTLT